MIHNFLKLTLPILLVSALGGGALAQDNLNGAPANSALSIVVQPGDTAYSLARRAGLSVENLMSLNNLSSTSLKVGQVLTLQLGTAHVVQPGETLYALSRKYGVSLDALRAANTLPEDATLTVGATLRIPEPGEAPAVAVAQLPATTAPQPALNLAAQTIPAPVRSNPAVTMPMLSGNWRDNAQALMGVPYVWGGTSRTGTDCSGFVLQVFGPLGVKLPRVSADQARAGLPVGLNDLMPGDLVFFDTTGGGKVTHVGIYLGNDTFANANSYRGQVTVDHLRSDKYWMPRFLSARRVLPENIMASQ